jgi:probable HAF family extracellular repeat protein
MNTAHKEDNMLRRRFAQLGSIRRGKTMQPALAWLATVLTLVAVANATGVAQEVTGTFVPIEVPGASFTLARAITADGRIVGIFGEASGRQHGFLLADGSFTTIDVPVTGARSTNAFGINARGDIVGSWVDSRGVQHGFHWPVQGPFTVIDGPSITDDGPTIRTLAKGINAQGDVTGYYDTEHKRHGFLLSRHGVFSTIDMDGSAGPPPNGTFAQWINARGDIVGSFFNGAVHGFLMSGDTVTQLDVPFAGAVNTNAPGLNDRGDVVGFYTASGRQLAFRRDRHGNYETLEAPAAASSMLAIGINTPGDIVGQYTQTENGVSVTRGFVMYRARTP